VCSGAVHRCKSQLGNGLTELRAERAYMRRVDEIKPIAALGWRQPMHTFIVERQSDAWIVKRQSQLLGSYSDRVHAISAAIDFANDEGNADREATVVVEEEGTDSQTVWTYGEDTYPSPDGRPGNTRTRGTYRLP
jgi:hypothetical protein